MAVVHSKEDKNCAELVKEFRDLIKLKGFCIPITIEKIVELAQDFADYPETKSLYKNIENRYCKYEKLKDYLEE